MLGEVFFIIWIILLLLFGTATPHGCCFGLFAEWDEEEGGGVEPPLLLIVPFSGDGMELLLLLLLL